MSETSLWEFIVFPFTYPARNPLFWLLVPPGFIFMGAVAGGQPLPPEFFWALPTWTYPAAFIIFSLNDLYDDETDKHNDREFVKDDVITEEDCGTVWGWTIIFTVLFFLPLMWFGKLSTVLLGSGMLFAAVAYSVPPLRLKQYPLTSVALMAVSGWLIYAFGYSFTGDVLSIPTRSFFYGLLSHTAVSLGALPDMEADNKAGITTFPLKYGEQATLLLGLVAVVATLLSGTVSGVVFWYIATYGAAMLSMMVFKRYMMHFKALSYIGVVCLIFLVWRGARGFII